MERPLARVRLLPDGVMIVARAGDTLLDALLDHGIALEHECGGNCTCTTCHLHVVSGTENLTPIEEPESYRLQFAEGRTAGSRLACQAIVMGQMVTVMRPAGAEIVAPSVPNK
jgi:2Fe-2S ferredoxin